ncbi:1-phosphatidylinositol-4,5-bisphosphate phosphodiesterase gamma 2 [Stachybotrys elegans]|uniref:Phosphoinositide phospholipase C n=1 Tax=Stachybotrys elegans TaxID=80388 RepID=A0A8K0SSB9_9HYPO|nr:1-phosphatidylinositol-4,5-bisphosphate phosphodiesterase gamma 2 [Stachybotrys elegans]
MSFLKDKIAGLFSSSDGDDDNGEEITPDGSGLESYHTTLPKDQLRVSPIIRAFLAYERVLSLEDANINGSEPSDALRALLNKPHAEIPSELLDLSHPLPEYYMSSSHNTYLLAHQLYGESNASGYELALRTGSRCVEIDAWDNDQNEDEPKVTHGYTLVSNVPFRLVCETIAREFDREAEFAAANPGTYHSPIFLSLENHCNPRGQLRLAEIMKEVFGPRLLSKAVRDEGTGEQAGTGEHVTMNELAACIAVIVEYHLPEEAEDSLSSSDEDDSSDDEVKEARKSYKNKKKAEAPQGIIPELAELGVYAQSVKPRDNSWFESEALLDGPHHHLINVSESGLAAHMPDMNEKIARHNASHLMRVFPKGLRISSSNLLPVRYWGVGAQICALNWQNFGISMQLNEALFHGSHGFVLKPAGLRKGGDGKVGSDRKKRLRLHVAGVTDIPLHEDAEMDGIRPYLTCTLHQPTEPGSGQKQKTSPYKLKKPHFLYDGELSATSPLWNEILEWEYEDNELTFLRMLVKSDESFSRNPKFAVAAVRLQYVTPGWSFVRLLDLKGRETASTLLLKFDIDDA